MPAIHKSNKNRQGIFISYARSDGKNFADDLRHRLIDEYHFQVWQDIVELEGGKDWWLQIEAAIKSVEFLVMVMTPGALASQTTRKEWRLARQEGVCVLPVMAEAIDFSSLPRWMRDTHFFDFKFPEQWDRFIRTLQSPCATPRVPFMVEDKPDDFVERPEEFNQLLALLLDPKREEPIAITAALRGAGGYGKTTLAKALCHDEAIQNAFDDGILWVTLGENPGDLTGRVEDLIYTLSGERPGFSSVQAAAARLAELLADRDILLVIDDVWNSAHLTPFLQGGLRCSRLITTRNSDTLPAKAKGIDLDAMRTDEATSLLGFNLPEGENSRLQPLAQRLGEWPLLLKLVNATLRYHVHDLQQAFAEAIAYVNAALDECGLIAFDHDNATERHQAVAKTLEVSLQMLDEGSRQRYFELAIFPEDVNIPLITLEKLWSAAGYKPIHTEKLCEKLHKLSLLLHFDLNDRTIRLHDVMRQYLMQKIGADLPKLHARFLDTYRSFTPIQNWANLPADEPYLWRHLAYHLHRSGQAETLRSLLLNYDWLYNKLAVCEVNALLADYDLFSDDQDLKLIQSALRLSANQLTKDYEQLTSHLLGRLTSHDSLVTQNLLDQSVKNMRGSWLRPVTTSLIQPGGPMLKSLEGHRFPIEAVAISSDNRLAISASQDKTLKVWDIQTGEFVQILEGHSHWVTVVEICADNKRVASGSVDGTLKIWDLPSGKTIFTLEGHSNWITAIAITPDSKFIVSGSRDNTIRIWNLETGKLLLTFGEHDEDITALQISSDGSLLVSASRDGIIKLWDMNTNRCRISFGHRLNEIKDVAIMPDNIRILTASVHGNILVWDLVSGQIIHMLHGNGIFNATQFHSQNEDALRKISYTQNPLLFHGNYGSISALSISSDGKLAVSSHQDGNIRVWDINSGTVMQTLVGHSGAVTDVVMTSDGNIAVSSSKDYTLKVWALKHQKKAHEPSTHNSKITALSFSPNGDFLISASRDKIVVWNPASGTVLRVIESFLLREVVAITPDCKSVISNFLCRLTVRDLVSGAVSHELEGNALPESALPFPNLAITPDSRLVVYSTDDDKIRVYDLVKGKAFNDVAGHDHLVTGV